MPPPPPIALSIDELVGNNREQRPDDIQELKHNAQQSNVQTQQPNVQTQWGPVNAQSYHSIPNEGDKGKMKPVAGKRGDQNLEETFKLPPRYKYMKLLGHGAYGMVCCAMDMQNGSTVAVKRINQIDSLLVAKRTLRELKLLRHFRNQQNIIQLIDVFEVDTRENSRFDKLFIVQELMDSDLCHIIASKHPITVDLIRSFMHQLLQGLKALHDAEVLHRDLKPGNLLWKQNGTLKICDFGLARGISEQQEAFDAASMTNYVATRWYRPPEILLYRAKYGKSLDMWSVGCIFAELLGRRVFLPGQSGVEQLNLILRKVGFPSEEEIDRIPSPKSQIYLRRLPRPVNYPFSARFPTATPTSLNLLERLLKFNPEDRISCAEALRHPYFAGMVLPEPSPIMRFNFDFDSKCETLKDIKTQILAELSLYHKPSVEYPLMSDSVESKEGISKSPTSILQRLGFGRSLK